MNSEPTKVRDPRLWQFRPDGLAKLFACVEDVPADEGWRNRPYSEEEIAEHGKLAAHSEHQDAKPHSEGDEGSGDAETQNDATGQTAKDHVSGKDQSKDQAAAGRRFLKHKRRH